MMTHTDAVNIVQSLAHGVDPESGEVYPQGSPYQRAEVVRALFIALQALERSSDAEKRKQRLPENTGKPWPEEEDVLLASGFDQGKSEIELARTHQRTQAGVHARLVKLGKIAP